LNNQTPKINPVIQTASSGTSLQPDAVICRRETRHLSNPVGDEIVLLNLDSGDYLGFNKMAAVIWQLLERPMRISDLEEALRSRFDVDSVTCHRETLDFLDRIDRLGLLAIESPKS
jgi:hypothetical protein